MIHTYPVQTLLHLVYIRRYPEAAALRVVKEVKEKGRPAPVGSEGVGSLRGRMTLPSRDLPHLHLGFSSQFFSLIPLPSASWTSAVDMAVYSKMRHFRMVWSCKGGKKAVLHPSERCGAARGARRRCYTHQKGVSVSPAGLQQLKE